MDKSQLGFDYLKESIGWLSFNYPDGTIRYMRTTLNDDILESVRSSQKVGHLYDLDKQKWVKVPSRKDIKINITSTRPDIGRLMEFVNRFV